MKLQDVKDSRGVLGCLETHGNTLSMANQQAVQAEGVLYQRSERRHLLKRLYLTETKKLWKKLAVKLKPFVNVHKSDISTIFHSLTKEPAVIILHSVWLFT